MPDIVSKRSRKRRDAVCNKKLNLCPFQCRCDENKFFALNISALKLIIVLLIINRNKKKTLRKIILKWRLKK